MGGKTSTTTQQVQIPQEVLDRYNAVNAQAQTAAARPFQIYSNDPSAFVAQLNQQQLTGIGNVNAAAGAYQPYLGEATDATRSGMASVMPGQLEIDKYMNPYQQQVIDATMKQMGQANEQAQSGALGTAISSGAFGGDRAGIAAANLANQQGLSMGSTLAGLNAQNYSQALQTAQQQQGLGLSAEQANLARLLSGGQQMAGLGQLSQSLGLQGAEAQINAGTLQQQTDQAGLSALYNQFQQQQAYPFQVAQFLANIAMGTGALSGSTTTTTQPYSFFSDRRLKHDIKRIGKTDEGMPIYTFKYKGDDSEQTHVGFMADEVEKHHPDAVGVDPASGYKTVDYERATKAGGGGVAGPYGAMVGSQPGVGGYVPQAYLPVGDLMVADSAGLENAQKTLAQQMEAAANFGENMIELKDRFGKDGDFWDLFSKNENSRGGVVGYASGGPAYLEGGLKPSDNPVEKESYLSDTLRDQEETKKNQMMQPGSAPGQPESTMSKIGNAASTALSVAQLASMFSDRRMKHSIRRIGKTDDGMPIYRFKYKGDENEQTHIGFMADEVERKHPDAVSTASNGMKRVDYSQAHKFYQGGLVRPGYAVGGGPETEEEIIRRRLLAGDVPQVTTLGSLPDATVTPARETMPNPNLSGLARAAIERAEETPPAAAGLAPAASMRPQARPEPTALAAAAIERSGAQPVTEPGLAAARAPVDEVSEFYRTKILKQESNNRQFDANGNPLTSSAGAIGIGQVMPDTGPEAAEMAGLPWDEERFRTDADYNAALGEAYFRNMYDRFGSLDLASAAYNAGPGRLRSAMDRAGAMGGSYLDYLPEETQNYVASVTGAASRGAAYDDPLTTMSSSGVAGGAGSGSAGEEYKGGLRPTPDKPYDERTVVGKMFYNPDGTVNKDALLSILSGIGTMASSPSRYLGSAILQGIGGAANTYAGLEERRSDITKKRIDNANEFEKAFLRQREYNPEITREDFARSIGYTDPISLTDGLIGVRPAGDALSEYKGVKFSIFGNDLSRMVPAGDGITIPAGMDYGYLKNKETWLKSKVALGITEAVDALTAVQDQIQKIEDNYGQVVAPDGTSISSPGYAETKFPGTQTGQDLITTPLILKELPAETQANNDFNLRTDIMYDALKMLPVTGTVAPVFAELGSIAQGLGITESSDTATARDILAKETAKDALESMKSIPNSTDYSGVLSAAANLSITITPEAAEKIIAMRKAVFDYNEAKLEAYKNSGNLAKTQREFTDANDLKKFYDKAYAEVKGTLSGGVELQRPNWVPQDQWDTMSPEEQAEAVRLQ